MCGRNRDGWLANGWLGKWSPLRSSGAGMRGVVRNWGPFGMEPKGKDQSYVPEKASIDDDEMPLIAIKPRSLHSNHNYRDKGKA